MQRYVVYDYSSLSTFRKQALTQYETFKCSVTKEKQYNFMKIGCGFDIETTTIGKKAYMYHWQFSIGNYVILGRTWEQFMVFFTVLQEWLKKTKCHLLCWIANAGFEFQFIRKRIDVCGENVFATKKRSPIYFDCGRIQFRDALYLSGMGGLKNLAKSYCTKEDIEIEYNGTVEIVHGNQKLVGDIDYKKVRNSLTPLTRKEKQYTINDVTILSEFGMYCFNAFKGKIPLTKTGIVRQMVKDEIGDNKTRYMLSRKFIKPLFPKKAETYDYEMRYLFRGGYTHANCWFVQEVVKNVFGVDFTSSYPAVMLHFNYPMKPFMLQTLWNEVKTDGVHITDKRFEVNGTWAFVIEVVFTNIRRKTNHAIESKHKIISSRNAKYDNNRLIKADEITVKITEIDYFIYEMFYEWDTITIKAAKASQKGKLPDYLLKPLMKEYEKKCVLKKEGKDDTIEYKNAKANVNSTYGMTVTRLAREEIVYNMYADSFAENESEAVSCWGTDRTECETYEEAIEHQVLSPYWGIWVTAYARYQLLSVVAKIDEKEDHVIYCDTDSIYMKDTPRNRKIIEEFNKKIYWQNAKLPECFNDIGAFDEIMMKGDKSKGGFMFKTLGAKRYVKYKNGKCEVTVAGMRKGSFEESISTDKKTEGCITIKVDGKEKYVDYNELFDKFDNDLMLNIDESHKNTHSYNDVPHSDVVTDEYGNTEEMSELSSVGIYEIPFKLTMKDLYIALLLEIKDEKRLSFSEIRTNREDYLHRRESEIRNKH